MRIFYTSRSIKSRNKKEKGIGLQSFALKSTKLFYMAYANIGLQSPLVKAKQSTSANPRGSLGAATRQGKYGFAVLNEESKTYSFSNPRWC